MTQREAARDTKKRSSMEPPEAMSSDSLLQALGGLRNKSFLHVSTLEKDSTLLFEHRRCPWTFAFLGWHPWRFAEAKIDFSASRKTFFSHFRCRNWIRFSLKALEREIINLSLSRFRLRARTSSRRSRQSSRRKFATANPARPTSTAVPGVCASMLTEVSGADVTDKFIIPTLIDIQGAQGSDSIWLRARMMDEFESCGSF